MARRQTLRKLPEIPHNSREDFADGLRTVWTNCARKASSAARLVIRFGAINDRKIQPLDLLKQSFLSTPWRFLTVHNAGTASAGKRQAEQFISADSPAAITEHDIWAILDN